MLFSSAPDFTSMDCKIIDLQKMDTAKNLKWGYGTGPPLKEACNSSIL